MINTAFKGDCMVYMPHFSDKFFEWAVVDVQYGINAGNMAYVKSPNRTIKQKNGGRLNVLKKKYTVSDWDKTPPTQDYFNELCRVSKHQIIFGIDYCKWEGVGTGRIKWDKCVPDGVSFNTYETAYCSAITDTYEFKLLWSGMRQAKSLSEPTTQHGNKRLNEKRIHPTHKPILLYKRLFQHFEISGPVLDTHLGGGSIRIAAFDAGIDLYASEIRDDYYTAQENRFQLYTSQLQLNHVELLRQ